jgi:uncharacterized DUF497 family protein
VVNWSQFRPTDFDLEFHDEKLAAHGIDRFEIIEVLWNGFRALRNKRRHDRYRLIGRTDAGRALELIVVVIDNRTLRFITGWSL